ncbi:MAG: hypothetical protein DWQ36_12765 [Acidobacteria bacterium]|nr:MAG: hypothetical protein DWQ36_12765 [Acidobacteriota bacterium]
MAKKLRWTPTPEVLEELEALAWAFEPELGDLLGETGAAEGAADRAETEADSAAPAASDAGPAPFTDPADPAKSARRAALRAREHSEGAPENADVTTSNTVHLAKLPAFDHLSDAEYQDLMQRLVDGVEKHTRERLEAERKRPLGVQGVLRVHPHQRPKKTKRSPPPWFHATRESFKLLKRAYKAFLDAYLRAAALLRQGHRDVRFPEGCFPSRLPVTLPPPSARARAPG